MMIICLQDYYIEDIQVLGMFWETSYMIHRGKVQSIWLIPLPKCFMVKKEEAKLLALYLVISINSAFLMLLFKMDDCF